MPLTAAKQDRAVDVLRRASGPMTPREIATALIADKVVPAIGKQFMDLQAGKPCGATEAGQRDRGQRGRAYQVAVERSLQQRAAGGTNSPFCRLRRHETKMDQAGI
jgi:hypothetical protein